MSGLRTLPGRRLASSVIAEAITTVALAAALLVTTLTLLLVSGAGSASAAGRSSTPTGPSSASSPSPSPSPSSAPSLAHGDVPSTTSGQSGGASQPGQSCTTGTLGCVNPTPVGGDNAIYSQTPSGLSWIDVKDSRGNSIWNYELSVDRGGVTDPSSLIWGDLIVPGIWQTYKCLVALAIWFVDWVVGFDWLTWMAAPFLAIGTALQALVAQLGLVPTFLTCTAFIGAMAIFRGRWATGLWEVAMALVIASLASTVLINPVAMVAGPHGLIMQSRDWGLEASSALANNGQPSTTSNGMRQDMTGAMVDTFVRAPLEAVNFGGQVDGTKCEAVYDKVIANGPYGDNDDIRDAVDGCNQDLGDYADNPGSGMAISALFAIPAGVVLLLFSVLLAGAVLMAVFNALFQGVKCIVTLVTGLLPGGGRGSFFMTVAETAISLALVVFSLMFLSAFLFVAHEVFTERAKTGETMQAFVLVDIVIVLGIVTFWRYRGRIKASAGKLAARLAATRPGPGGSGSMPAARGGGLSAASGTGVLLASRALSRRRPQASSMPQLQGSQTLATPIATWGRPDHAASRTWAEQRADTRSTARAHPAATEPRALPPGRSGGDTPAGTSPAGPGSPGTGRPRPGRVRQAAAGAARLGVRAALAYASGGTSLAAAAAGAAAGEATSKAAARVAGRAMPTKTSTTSQPPAGPSSTARPHPSPSPAQDSTPPSGEQANGRARRATGRQPGQGSAQGSGQGSRREARWGAGRGPARGAAVDPAGPAAAAVGYDRIVRDGQVILVPRT